MRSIPGPKDRGMFPPYVECGMGEGMRVPIIPAIIALVVLAMATDYHPLIIAAFGGATAYFVWLSARREEEAEALIAEIHRQAVERGFEPPEPPRLQELVVQYRATKRGKRR